MSENDWEKKLKKDLKKALEDHDGIFGHNIEVDIKQYLKRLKKRAVYFDEIEVLDYCTIRITLPCDDHTQDIGEYREAILLFILTEGPMPSECKYDKSRDQLTIEWHY